MRREAFTVSRRLSFEAITGSGDVEVLSSGSDDVVVELRGGPEDQYLVELNGSDLVVIPPTKRSGKRRFVSTDIKLYVPPESCAGIKTASGDIIVTTELSELTVATASGDVRVSEPMGGDCNIKTASGDVKLRGVDGHLSIATASGDVLAGDVAGDLTFNSASGDIRAGAVAGMVEIRGVSADASIDAVRGHTVRAKTLSGDVRLGIPPGRSVDLDMQTLSGEVVNRISPSGEFDGKKVALSISIKTVSGDLKLENA